MLQFRPQFIASTVDRIARLMARPYVAYALLVLAVWWPEGFNIGPVTDGWINITDLYLLPARFTDRALQRLPWVFGRELTPGSFVGLQLLLFTLSLLRGILAFEIGKRLFPRLLPLALACGLLALFHPADQLYFWVEWVNVDTAWVLTLAACLAALVYLQDATPAALWALWLLQLLCCLTYSGFLPVMLVFPVCIWMLQWLAGEKTRASDLWKTTFVVLLYIILVVVQTLRGLGREGQVSDFDVWQILGGYTFQLRSLFLSVPYVLRNAPLIYLVYGLVPAAVIYVVALRAAPSAESNGKPRSWKYFAGLSLALVVLAALSYLPYSLTNLRYGNLRQMLAAGFFAYLAILLPAFVWLSHRRLGMPIACLAVALLAVCTTTVGLEARSWNVAVYRSEEALIAGVAKVLPRPPHGTLVVVKLDNKYDGRNIAGFYGRPQAFAYALRLMYGDTSLDGAFIDVLKPAPFSFGPDGLTIAQSGHTVPPELPAPYSRLVLIEYRADHTAQILDNAWLQQQAPKGVDVSAYAPPTGRERPEQGAHICSLLQRDLRPAYCD